MAYLLKDKKSI